MPLDSGLLKGGKTADESHNPEQRNRLSGRVATPVVAVPFHPVREPGGSKAPLNGLNHQIARHLASNAAGGGVMADDFTITAIQREGDSYHLPIPAGNVKAIGTPAQIGTQGLPCLHKAAWVASRCVEQAAGYSVHNAIDPLVVDSKPAHSLPHAVKERAYPAVSVGHAAITSSDQGQKPGHVRDTYAG